MNEDFIRQFRKTPDVHFVETIHIRLERKERVQVLKKNAFFSVFALIFAFGILMSVSSTVRAEVLQTLEDIAGLRFDVTSHYPGDTDGEVHIIDSEYLSLQEAQKRFPSPIVLPTYIPQGYERDEDVALTPFTDPDTPLVEIVWRKAEVSNFNLSIFHCPMSLQNCGLTVGTGALEEITLNGKPAALVHGMWNADTQQYDLSTAIAIRWKYDENTIYTISTFDSSLPLDELIQIAESIP